MKTSFPLNNILRGVIKLLITVIDSMPQTVAIRLKITHNIPLRIKILNTTSCRIAIPQNNTNQRYLQLTKDSHKALE